jgi:hypothetical protein
MVIEDQLVLATVCPSHHAEHNELRNHTLNVKACEEGRKVFCRPSHPHCVVGRERFGPARFGGVGGALAPALRRLWTSTRGRGQGPSGYGLHPVRRPPWPRTTGIGVNALECVERGLFCVLWHPVGRAERGSWKISYTCILQSWDS